MGNWVRPASSTGENGKLLNSGLASASALRRTGNKKEANGGYKAKG